jgi:hypothetical protein
MAVCHRSASWVHLNVEDACASIKEGTYDMGSKRSATVVSSTALAGLLLVTGVASADQGNWSTGCAAGWTCMWEGTVGPSAAVASTIRDSNFTGDVYPSVGMALNNRVKHMQNRFTSTSVRGYSGADYTGTAWVSTIAGDTSGAYPFGTTAGMSSFKSC